MNDDIAVAALGALANSTRLALMRRLVKAGPEGMAAGEIAVASGLSPSHASFHLSALAEAGLVTSEKVSRRIIYRPDFRRFGALVDFILEDCCGGSAEVRACCRSC